MSDPAALSVLKRRSAFPPLPPAAQSPSAGVRVEVRGGLGLASIAARKGCAERVAAIMQEAFGVAAPPGRQRSAAGDLALMGVGPQSWLAVCERPPGDWPQAVAGALKGVAAVADQSGAYGVLRLSGARVRHLLAKGVFLDLHDTAFPVGRVAATSLAHFSAILWRLDGEGLFEIAVGRSVAHDVWRWIEESAAEYGLSVAGPAD